MDADERDIFNYLKTWGKDYIGIREICRRAGGKKRFHENPEWAKHFLVIMKERGIIESDAMGRYRVKPVNKKAGAGRWISPDIEKLLKEKGVQVENKTTEVGSDEYYDQL